LSKAKRLQTAQIGEGGEPSTAYGAYKTALKSLGSISFDELSSLTNNGAPGGRIYGALLLCQKDPGLGRAKLVDFLNDKTACEFQTGCEIFSSNLADIAKDLLCKGEFWDFKIDTAGGAAKTTPMYLGELMDAANFADQTPAESGPHREFLVYDAASRTIDGLKVADLETVVRSGEPAGKLYAAALLKQKSPQSKPFDSLLNDKTMVLYFGGCKGFPTTVADVAKELKEKGKFRSFSVRAK